jgi:hypothetical protein
MKEFFFADSMKMEEHFNNPEKVKAFITSALFILLLAKKIKPTKEFFELPVHFVEKEDRKGFVLELPNPEYECECNYAGFLQKDDGTKLYYTSEYYSMDDTFMLCKNEPGAHYALNKQITSLKDFIDAI